MSGRAPRTSPPAPTARSPTSPASTAISPRCRSTSTPRSRSSRPRAASLVPALPADAAPINLGFTHFNLAQALLATGGDRARARAAALVARAHFGRAGAPAAGNVEQVDRWLRKLGP